jgi:hypothetical protein
MVRLVGTRNYQIKSFHVPVSIGRSEVMQDYMQGFFESGGSCEKPGGASFGEVTGIDAQLGWGINQRH